MAGVEPRRPVAGTMTSPGDRALSKLVTLVAEDLSSSVGDVDPRHGVADGAARLSARGAGDDDFIE